MRSPAALTLLLLLCSSCGASHKASDFVGHYVADDLSLCLEDDGTFLFRNRLANGPVYRGHRWQAIVPYSGSMIVVLDSLRLPGDAGWMVDVPQTVLESNWPPDWMRPNEALFGRLKLTAPGERPIVFLRMADDGQCAHAG